MNVVKTARPREMIAWYGTVFGAQVVHEDQQIAFLTWDEDFVIDITIRYWEKARKAGLMDFEDWHSDFGAFYRAVEWMGLQRHLKVAGIFARLTLRDGKAKYLADTPRFIHYIRSTAHRYRELGPLLKLVDEIEGLQAASGWAFGRV